MFDAVDGRARHGITEQGGLEDREENLGIDFDLRNLADISAERRSSDILDL